MATIITHHETRSHEVSDRDLTQINSPEELRAFAEEYGLRQDWHEPDEQDISATVIGGHLDNAMGPTVDHNHGELNVVLTHYDAPVAVINLATLLSWAVRA